MTEREVHIRCADALRSAAELQREAGELDKATTEYAAILEDLEVSWEGQSAQQYLVVARGRIDKLRRNAERYEALADAIVKTAKLYEKNELNKIRAAKRRR